ncbi:MAG: GntR family transcriptional regulator [Victivallales bacterium]
MGLDNDDIPVYNLFTGINEYLNIGCFMKENKKQDIMDFILKEVSSGNLKTGSQIPTEAELSDKYKTSMATAHRAVKNLEDAKIVGRVKGKGTFILDSADISSLDRLKYEREKKVHVILPLDNTLHVHWQEATLQALETTLKDGGYKIFYFEYDDEKGSPSEFGRILEEIISSGSNGIVVSTVKNISRLLGNNRRLLIEKQIPLFFHNVSGEYIPDIICNMISQDPYSDGALIGKLVSQRGYRDVVFVGSHEYQGGRFDSPGFWLQTRIRGIEFGLGTENNNIKLEIAKTREQYASICRRIKNAPGSICVVSVNARVAADLMDFAKENGLRSPQDFEIISFDDNPKFLKYNITALAAPFDRIGRTLGQMIRNSGSYMQNNSHIWIKIPYELKERQTFKVSGD